MNKEIENSGWYTVYDKLTSEYLLSRLKTIKKENPEQLERISVIEYIIRKRQLNDPELRLHFIYKSIPDVHCKKLCGRDICSVIPVTDLEYKRISENIKRNPEVKILPLGTYNNHLIKKKVKTFICHTCEFLINDECSIYNVRPLICRLWGAVKSMPCHYGCKPVKYLTDEQAFNLIDRSFSLDLKTKKRKGK